MSRRHTIPDCDRMTDNSDVTRLGKVSRQAGSYRLYYPVVKQGYGLRTLGAEAPFVDGVLRIEGILLHPTRCGQASYGTARRTCPITKSPKL